MKKAVWLIAALVLVAGCGSGSGGSDGGSPVTRDTHIVSNTQGTDICSSINPDIIEFNVNDDDDARHPFAVKLKTDGDPAKWYTFTTLSRSFTRPNAYNYYAYEAKPSPRVSVPTALYNHPWEVVVLDKNGVEIPMTHPAQADPVTWEWGTSLCP